MNNEKNNNKWVGAITLSIFEFVAVFYVGETRQ